MPVFVNLNLQGDPLVWIKVNSLWIWTVKYSLLNFGCLAYNGMRFLPQSEPLCRNDRVCGVSPVLPFWHSAQLMWFVWWPGDFCLEVISSCCALTLQILLFVDPHTQIFIFMSILSGKFGDQQVGLLWTYQLSLAHSIYMQNKRQLGGQIDGSMLNCWLYSLQEHIFLCTNSIPYACFLIILNVF